MNKSILKIQKVTKVFGGLVAINKLDLELAEHGIHSVIGPNGAGKTTLFNCITGFYKPER
jgi:branched-chain amino acid transport system ATP-binding protein